MNKKGERLPTPLKSEKKGPLFGEFDTRVCLCERFGTKAISLSSDSRYFYERSFIGTRTFPNDADV